MGCRPMIKWAEEGYTVVEVQALAVRTTGILDLAIKSLQACDKCDNSERVGLIGIIP